MSKEKIVTTINNEKLPISKCRHFEKGWYKIGNSNVKNSGDCYFIKNKYYREENDNVVFNYSINEYVLKDSSLVLGVVDVQNNELVLGYFYQKDYLNYVYDKNDKKYLLLNSDILKFNKTYRELLANGDYYHISLIKAHKFNEIRVPHKEYKYTLPYDSKGITNDFLDFYNNNYKPTIFENVKNYSKVLKNLTFGLEFETSKGFIPKNIINNYGIIPLRDGSISGIEYVTVPLSGEKGLQYIIDIVDILKYRTTYDNTCSLHQHIGNIPRTKEFILAFFKLTCAIQNEIFEMFPLYKKYNFNVKSKNYSKPYPVYDLLSQMDSVINDKNIDENFNVLYRYLSEIQDFKEVNYDLNNVHAHPKDPAGNSKWFIKNRYYFHNLIPLIFGNKQTIEFRIHTPTYDTNKIIAFLLINSILINYCIDNQKSILENKSFLYKIKLDTIIVKYLNSFKLNNSKLEMFLLTYINYRKSETEYQNTKGLIIGNELKIDNCSEILNWTVNFSINDLYLDREYRNNLNFISDIYETEIDSIENEYYKNNISKDTFFKKVSSTRALQNKYRLTLNLNTIPSYYN